MQLTIENVEHLTLDLGSKTHPGAAFLASLFAKPEDAATPATPVQTTAQPGHPPAIGERWPEHGGIYAGVSRGPDGEPDGHIILLDDKPEKDLAWADGAKWAEGLGNGARLPTRFESALLYANLQDQFDTDRWHWTGTQYTASPGFRPSATATRPSAARATRPGAEPSAD